MAASSPPIALPWYRRHPAAFVLGCFVVFEAVHLAIAWNDARLVRTALPWLPDAWLGPAVWAIYSLIAVGLAAALGWLSQIGLTRPGRRAALGLLAYPLATGAVFLLLGINIERSQLVPIVLVGAPLIALNEEVFFRGIVLEGLRPQGWRNAIIGSAFLFGFAHSLNLVAGANLPFTVMQIAATTAGGVTLAALRIRSGSLWPVIGLHVALDVMALTTLTAGGVDHPMLLPILFAWFALNLTLWAYGWRLVRGRSDDQLDALYDGSTPAD
jgi:membrane protease YdiL (CAAX protease family)